MGVGGSPGPVVLGSYLHLSSGDLTSTSSHICGSWYLPILLFRNQYCLFDGPGNILVLPANYAEIVQRQFMTSVVVMVICG